MGLWPLHLAGVLLASSVGLPYLKVLTPSCIDGLRPPRPS